MADLLTPTQLSEELDMTVEALAQWRYKGVGPRFLKEGRWVRYRRQDVEAWLANCVHERTDRPVGGAA